MAVSMQRCIVFNRADLRQPWLVTHSEVIDGVEFVKLSLTDSGFNRFVSGTTKGCKTMKWLDDFRQQRCIETLKRTADASSIFGGPPSKAARAKQKKDCMLQLQNGTLPNTISIAVPSVEYDGQYEGARMLKVVTAVDQKACLQVEASAEVLSYVRVAMLASQGSRKRTRRDDHTGCVRFADDTNTFVARRVEGGKVKTRSFKVCDSSHEVAHECAQRWACNESTEEDEEENSSN